MANNDDLLKTMRSRLQMAIDAYSESRDVQLDDKRFVAGSPDNRWQWPADVLQTRGSMQGQSINARPCLTINKLPQHVKQITNDQRQNRPSGKVIPANEEATEELAEILNGIVRHIEYISDADVAYDTACENQVEHGEGYFRLLTDYCDDDSFNQDIKIGRIRNPFSVYMDPTIQDPCGADAKWCFITQDLTKPEYESQYPDATPISTIQSMFGTGDTGISQWLNEDTVRIAEYFYLESVNKKLNLYNTGDSLFSDDPRAEFLKSQGAVVIKSRDVEAKKVKWIKTNGYEVLEEQDWPGKYIPVIRVIGNEYEIEGRIHISGIVRNAKDPQRMYNYWVSQEAEMLALAPKAPFIGYGGQFEGYEEKWKTANVVNYPYLEVNPDVTDAAGSPLPLPQRAMPPMPQAGLIQAKMGASDDIKATTGQYDPSLGAKSNETSGKAILARERQADTGTYHYVDNLARAVRFATRQIIDLIPKIYDTRRIARIIGVDGEVSQATLDPTAPQAMVEIKNELGKVIERIYNPNIGKYDVMVTTGPSYMTKRQEAMNAMAQLLQGNPQLWQVAGDLFIKNMDWPGAEEMAKRFSNTIPPQIKQDEEEQQGQIPPQVQQAIQMAQQHIMQQDQVIAELQKKAEGKEEEERHKDLDLQIKAYQAETDRMAKLAPAITAEQVQALVVQTMQQMLAQPPIYESAQEEAQEHQMMQDHQMMMGQMQPQMQGQQMPPEMGGQMQQ